MVKGRFIPKIRLILLGMLALLAVSLATPVSASAHSYVLCKKVAKGTGKYKNNECKTEGGEKEWVKEPVVLGEEQYEMTGENKPATTIKLETSAFTVECESDRLKGGLVLSAGRSIMTVEFSGCKIPGVLSCTVSSFKFVIKDQLVTFAPAVGDEIKLQSGSEVTITCLPEPETVYKLRGYEKCEMPSAKEMKKVHVIKCTPSGLEEEVEGEPPLKFTGTWEVEVPPYFWAVE
jgi:hypothetical protein